MTTQYTVFAVDSASLAALLIEHDVLQPNGQPVPGMAYEHRGRWSVGGASMTSVCGLIWYTAEPADQVEAQEREALLDGLRADGALYEGIEQPIYLMGTSGYQRPTGWEWIKRERDARKLSRGYQAAGKWFHSDHTSRGQQLGLVIAAGAGLIPPGLQWKTMDGTFVAMTGTLAQQIFAAAMTSDATYHAVAEAARAQWEAGTLTDLTAIQWPAGYTGV